MTSRTLKALVLAGLCALLGTTEVVAQGATPENTVIRNIASVSFTDANGNSYTPVADTVDVTVGFVAGVDVAGPATATPVVGSTNDTLTYTMQNLSNGRDTLTVSSTVDAAVMINVRYRFNGTTYATVGALNTALAAYGSIAQDSTITIQVIYDVPAGSGGLSGDFTITGRSKRDPTKSDTLTTTVTPSETIDVTVTPDDTTVQRLPNSGTVPTYVNSFWVKNTGNGPEDYTIAASRSNPTVITSATPSITSVNALAAGDSVLVNVTYVVANVAAPSIDTLYLTATSVTGPGAAVDSGSYIVTVVKPAITVVKEAYRDDGTTLIGASDSVVPQEFIRYKITVTNSGAAAAQTVVVDDVVPAELQSVVASDPTAAGWNFTGTSGNTVKATLASLAGGGSAEVWIRAQVK